MPGAIYAVSFPDQFITQSFRISTDFGTKTLRLRPDIRKCDIIFEREIFLRKERLFKTETVKRPDRIDGCSLRCNLKLL